MPGVVPVSAEYYRNHLGNIASAFEWLQQNIRTASQSKLDRVAADCYHSALCLSQSDCAEVTPAERDQFADLYDRSAGFLIRHRLCRRDVVKREGLTTFIKVQA